MSNKIHKHGTGYAQITNEILGSRELSLSAKGLYSFMFSKPEGWNFTIRSMASQLKEGQCAIKTAIDDLKESGWMAYEKHADGTGTYTLYINPNVENPNVDFPNLGNSTPISKTDIVSKKDYIYSEVDSFWNNNTANLSKCRKITEKHERAINGILSDGYTQEDILQAIAKYNHIVNGEQYYFDHKWNLLEFLKREGGCRRFADCDDDSIWLKDKKQSFGSVAPPADLM